MKKMKDYFSTEQLADLADLSDHEKLSMALSHIKSVNPKAKFKCSELAEFLGKNPKAPRGMYPMVGAIKRKDPDFPIEMVDVQKGGAAQTYNQDKLGDLKSRWASAGPSVAPALLSPDVSIENSVPEQQEEPQAFRWENPSV